jgi:hypothetical protein
MELGVYIAIGTFALTTIGYAIKLTWQVRNIEREISDDFDAHIENLQRDVVRLDREALSRAETMRHETGEMGSAIRQKLHEIEVYSRDTFVRKDSFDQAVTRLEKTFEKGFDKLEVAIDRLREEK